MSVEYWTTKNGEKISVDDMDLTHLRNTLKMIIHNARKNAEARKETHSVTLHGEMAQQWNDINEEHDMHNDCDASELDLY